MTENEAKIFRIANNILYFDDSSDYGTALWEILVILKPEIEDNLEYIEETATLKQPPTNCPPPNKSD